MVSINEYQRSYFDIVLSMHESQHYAHALLLSPETLPVIGFIATEGAIPVAAGFLRMIEGGYAQIDTLVSNAGLAPQMRHEALTMIVNTLINKAKDLKLQGLICLTSDKSVLVRAEALGFHVVNQQVIALPL